METLAMLVDAVRQRIQPVVSVHGVKLRAHRLLSRKMRTLLYEGRYEGHELDLVRRALADDDTVLELGCGLGLLSIFCTQRLGSDRVVTLEANPAMEPIIRENFALNGVSPKLLMAAVGPQNGHATFFVRENFYAGSCHPGRWKGSIGATVIPVRSLDSLIAQFKPTLLICDVEGVEATLFDTTSLAGVRKVIVEVHPGLIGQRGVQAVRSRLAELGFAQDPQTAEDDEWFMSR